MLSHELKVGTNTIGTEEPSFDLLVLVGSIIVYDQMQVQLSAGFILINEGARRI
jgi:hypothetical protein